MSRTLALTIQKPTNPSGDPGTLTGRDLAMADASPDALWNLYGFDPNARESWLQHPHKDLKFCDVADGSCILICIASDSYAIWLGKFPSRGKAIHAVLCFCLQTGEFHAPHFEAEARAHYAAVLAKARPAEQEMSFVESAPG